MKILNFNKKKALYILLFILCFVMPWMLLSENMAKVIYMFYFLSFGTWIVFKGMKISWIAKALHTSIQQDFTVFPRFKIKILLFQ